MHDVSVCGKSVDIRSRVPLQVLDGVNNNIIYSK